MRSPAETCPYARLAIRLFGCGLLLLGLHFSAHCATVDLAQASLDRNGKRDASFVHDPSTILRAANGEYWFFSTGTGIHSWRSKDLISWQKGPAVFTNWPGWVTNVVANHRGHFWAPDVILHEGQYWLYYSVSRFGVNTSAIGIATNPALDPLDPQFRWSDRGIVIQSTRTNNFNAIDPHLIKTSEGEIWMSFGSFWSGIKLVQLAPKTGLRLQPDGPLISLAHHQQIEAPAIHQHDGYYYLFVNWGICCRGTNSTYEIRVGRSQKITGPYLDKAGADMAKGGGSLLLQTDEAFIGPGHAGIFDADGRQWFSCHFYDGTNRGAATLAIRPLRWDEDGWPILDPIKKPAASE